MNTFISIIVTSYTPKQIKDIEDLFASIKSQSYAGVETIFVVERSQELFDFVRSREQDVPRLKTIFNNGKAGISASRNLGISESKGNIIAFVDDDAVLPPHWARDTAAVYEGESTIVGLTGPIIPLWEEPSMAWFPKEFYWIFACTYWDWKEPHEVRNGYGTNISFRREAFDIEDLFPKFLGSERSVNQGKQATTCEETELSLRIRRKTGKRIVYHPSISVNHKVHQFRLTSRYLWKRAFIEGCSKMIIRKVYRNKLKQDKVLQTEYDLLKRIFTRLFPGIFKGMFTRPRTAWRQLKATLIVLTAVACGYFSGIFKKAPI